MTAPGEETFYDPVVKQRLRRAIKSLLRERHGHLTPAALTSCGPCVQRLWEWLARVAPEAYKPSPPNLHPEQR